MSILRWKFASLKILFATNLHQTKYFILDLLKLTLFLKTDIRNVHCYFQLFISVNLVCVFKFYLLLLLIFVNVLDFTKQFELTKHICKNVEFDFPFNRINLILFIYIHT